jgi:hypothetical protein
MKLLDANTEGKFAMHLPETAEPETGPATVARSSTLLYHLFKTLHLSPKVLECQRHRTGKWSNWYLVSDSISTKFELAHHHGGSL